MYYTTSTSNAEPLSPPPAIDLVPIPPPDHGNGAANSASQEPNSQFRAEMEAAALRPHSSLGILSRVFFALAFLLALRYLIPYMVERCEYAITLGRQKAQYELAATGLKNVGLESLSTAFQMISRQVGPSVVHIDVLSAEIIDRRQTAERMFGPRFHESVGQGSGVIVDPDGYIVTNNHVIAGAKEIQVSLSDGRRFPAVVLGRDEATDVAVLKIDGDQLVAAEWGDSEAIDEGALVWAVGSPFGLQRTITFGIVSAKHRSGMAGDVYQDFLQSDAAVNPGNSGGPLVDARGRVIGINTAILGESYQGVSFAIPSSVAKKIYEQLKQNGSVARGWLGVQLVDLDNESVQKLGLENTDGALVTDVIEDPNFATPAHNAGMKRNDVVISWNGTAIRKPAELIRAVAMTDVGTKAKVVVIRDGKELTLEVLVARRPDVADR